MDKRFFFITTYDNISGALIASVLNIHPDVHCGTYLIDPFINESDQHDKNSAEETVDAFIESNTRNKNKFNGNSQRYSAYELQNKLLMEKTRHPLRKVNLAVSPRLRINFLIKSWLDAYKNPDQAVIEINNKINELRAKQHPCIVEFRFNDIIQQIQKSACNENIDLTNSNNQLFLIALTRVITQDSADLPTSGKIISLEKLLYDNASYLGLINYLTGNDIIFNEEYKSSLQTHLNKASGFVSDLQNQQWEPWQTRLLDKYLSLRLQTLYYQHVNKPLAAFYKELGYEIGSYQDQQKIHYSKLISIHLNSNRPAQLSLYFDNIEDTADDPSLVEVLVNIDDNDSVMEETLKREISQRKFTIKYITTPRPKSFCDLWEPINKLLPITDPHAYFLLNISDEMLFATKGWDSVLKKYVGFFPDHIFRLRASRNKFRNYFDRWECSFAQDAIPITTKKWIDIGGDWNPCFGPDSFQQLIAFYLAKEGQFAGTNYLREMPIIDIKFLGDIPSIGIDPQKAWKHNRDHIFAMQICQSYPMQLEARRRAVLLKANIIAVNHQIATFKTIDNKNQKQIDLINTSTNETVYSFDYKVSWFYITFINQFRKLRYYAYFGAGKEYNRGHITGFASYLRAKYSFFNRLYHFLNHLRGRYKMKLSKFISMLKKTKRTLQGLMPLRQVSTQQLLKKIEVLENENQTLRSRYQKILSEYNKLKGSGNPVTASETETGNYH